MKQALAESLVNGFRKYADTYHCTNLEAVQDRDFPLTADELRVILPMLGMYPLASVVELCRPDSQESLDNYDWHNEE